MCQVKLIEKNNFFFHSKWIYFKYKIHRQDVKFLKAKESKLYVKKNIINRESWVSKV